MRAEFNKTLRTPLCLCVITFLRAAAAVEATDSIAAFNAVCNGPTTATVAGASDESEQAACGTQSFLMFAD